MSEIEFNCEPESSFGELESLVRRAGSYVQPTENLRPKSLEAAREATRQQRNNRRLGGAILVVVLLGAIGFPSFLRFSSLGPAFVRSDELHRRATQSALNSSVGTHWALYEVFCELRREQSELLNHVD